MKDQPPELPPEVPPEVHQLLAGPIDSFEKLEILRLACQRPDDVWTAGRLADVVRVPSESVDVAFAELIADQFFVACVDGYRLAPQRPGETSVVATLCRLYENERLLIVRLMTSLAMGRIRNSAARAFSDAFRFRLRGSDQGGNRG
jgi:hypothetical protein